MVELRSGRLPGDLMTRKEAAEWADVSLATIQRLIQAKKLRVYAGVPQRESGKPGRPATQLVSAAQLASLGYRPPQPRMSQARDAAHSYQPRQTIPGATGRETRPHEILNENAQLRAECAQLRELLRLELAAAEQLAKAVEHLTKSDAVRREQLLQITAPTFPND